uniref:C2H2-type domain-containing protein n=1 Tax=Photinus pyralis TaxID=7054 RepID=A0A1Y1MYX5_PHOPY
MVAKSNLNKSDKSENMEKSKPSSSSPDQSDTSSSKTDSKTSPNVKLHVLSNKKVSVPQNCITEILKGSNTDIADSTNGKDTVETSSTEDIIPEHASVSLPTNQAPGDNSVGEMEKNKMSICETESEKYNELEPEYKRRGRKRKVIDYASLAEGDESDTSTNDITEGSEGKRKRGRPKKSDQKAKATLSKGNKSSHSNNTTTTVEEGDKPVKKKKSHESIVEQCDEQGKKKKPRGRYATTSQQSKLLTTVFQQINGNVNLQPIDLSGEHSESPLDAVRPGSSGDVDNKTNAKVEEKLVTCAVCNLQFSKLSWTQHKYRSHNNLAWRVGDPPLDLNNHGLVMSILTDLYKRKKPLYCENCGITKKSALGYLSHKSVCQRSANEVSSVRIKCEYCEHTVLPVSMSAHLKICRGLLGPDTDNEDTPCTDEPHASTSKRKAAAKAENIFKELQSEKMMSEPKKVRRSWYINFDFHPTGFGKKRINREIKANKAANCWFTACNFQSSDVQELENHIWKCGHKTMNGYTCKNCMFTFESEDQIVEHVKQVHSKSTNEDFVEEDNELECDMEPDRVNKAARKNPNQNKKLLLNGISFLLKQRQYPTSTAIRYPPSYDWSLKFCKQNYQNTNLFPLWKAVVEDYEKLDLNMYCKYIPQQKYSVSAASIESNTYADLLALNYQWKRYKLFESDLLCNDASTIFCGGSICAMAWAPNPHMIEECAQILAVCVNSKFNKGYPLDQLYKEPGMIQLWNCGTLSNSSYISEKPKLEYCIAHDHGPVWCMEWCPSGTYDVEESNYLRRLGLLAVGCADLNVYIYSVCFPGSLSGKIFKTKPLLKLALETTREITVNGIEPHPTTLSWSKAKDHQYLAVGYGNGMIGIFDMLSTASLLNFHSNDGEAKIMRPYQIFNAHYHAVTALHLFHLSDGKRWVMSGSLDRSIKYWDLDNPTVPISNLTKFIVTDGVWLNHWLSTVHTYDDCCGGGLTYSSVYQLRNYESECTSIMHSNSHVSSISGSDWINSFVQGNVAGEIAGFFPHQLFYALDSDKSFRKKKAILGYARLVEKNLSADERIHRKGQSSKKDKSQKQKSDICQNYKVDVHNEDFPQEEYIEPSSYEEADEKFGLVFCDMKLVSLSDLPANLSSYYKSNNNDKLFPSKPNIYPLQLINKVVINPNHNSYLYYATGYQSGFVRISSLKFVNKRGR